MCPLQGQKVDQWFVWGWEQEIVAENGNVPKSDCGDGYTALLKI